MNVYEYVCMHVYMYMYARVDRAGISQCKLVSDHICVFLLYFRLSRMVKVSSIQSRSVELC